MGPSRAGGWSGPRYFPTVPMATAVSTEGRRQGVLQGAWVPALATGRTRRGGARCGPATRSAKGASLLHPDPPGLAFRSPQEPCTFLFHLPQKPPLLASALTRAQPHQPWGSGTAPRTAPSGIALGDFSSAAVAVAAAMVARAAQNANYSLGHATGSVGGAEGRGCGLYSTQESVPRVAE